MTRDKSIHILILLIGIYSFISKTSAIKTGAQKFNNHSLVGPSNGKPCPPGKRCVPKYLCIGGKVNTDGSTIIDPRISINDGPCDLLETCCSTNDTNTAPVLKPGSTSKGCGYRNPEGVGYSMTGMNPNESQFGEFPWMVAILREEISQQTISTIYICGGSLITPRVVLTSAHCVYTYTESLDALRVRAGEWETNVKTELIPHQDREVADMIIHKNFDQHRLYYDIALIFVSPYFVLAPNVNTICLPPANTNFDLTLCYATGWGARNFQNGEYQNILKKIDLPIVPRDKCEKNLRTTRLQNTFELHSTFLCAGGERDKDTCTGDGGSPLVCPLENTPDRFQQVGIVGWGIGCGEEDIPGVYANVPVLRRWLDRQLANKNTRTSFYTP